MIRAVIFDMDGLMFDTERVFWMARDYAGEKTGIGKAGYMTARTLGLSTALSRPLYEKEFGGRYDEKKFRPYFLDFIKRYYAEHGLPVKKGLYELLRFLRENGYKMCVASTSKEAEVRHHLNDANVNDYFPKIVSGDMVLHSKPDPEIYRKACDMLEEKPGDCLALEDSPNGILSAYRAGCKPAMIPDLRRPDEETAKILFACFDSLADVIGFLKSMPKVVR